METFNLKSDIQYVIGVPEDVEHLGEPVESAPHAQWLQQTFGYTAYKQQLLSLYPREPDEIMARV